MDKKGLKWYFCLSQGAKDAYQHEVHAAVNSAIKNTTLRPHFVYDGSPDDLTAWLETQGVKVIYHKMSFEGAFESFHDSYKGILGTFLRIDVPLIETEDDFVLYTDTDVIFTKDIKLDEIGRPELFSASTQIGLNDWSVFNAGVMVMNIKNMKAAHKEIVDYIYKIHKGQSWHREIQDQEILNALYHKNNNFTKLNQLYNHKPYWGINEEAFIVHFHGPKPYFIQKCLANNSEIVRVFRHLLLRNFWGYKYYFELFEKYYNDVHVDVNLLYNYVNTVTLEEIRNRFFKVKIFNKVITFYRNKKITIEPIN